MILIKFLLFIFLLGLVAALFVVTTLWRNLRGFLALLRGQDRQAGDRHTRGGEPTVRHTEHRKGKKIFSPDEGEYVDFTEEK